MTGVRRTVRTRTIVWLAVLAGVLTVLLANAHLMYVAAVSQSACIDHVVRAVRRSAGQEADGPGNVRHVARRAMLVGDDARRACGFGAGVPGGPPTPCATRPVATPCTK